MHTKFKSLASNSNHSHRIQIIHTKLKSLTLNSNLSHQVSQHPHQISQRSHQIQISTPNFNLYTKLNILTCTTLKYSHQIEIFTPNWNLHTEFKSLHQIEIFIPNSNLYSKFKSSHWIQHLHTKFKFSTLPVSGNVLPNVLLHRWQIIKPSNMQLTVLNKVQ